jgi:transcription initiation factor TFIID TATA-box-binding protein
MQEQDPLNGATRILMLKWGLLLVDVRDSIRIENVVASATLDQKINLDSVVKGNPGVEYDPKTFPGLVYKIKRPKTSILIFRTGKMVCTGAKSSKEANKAVKKVVREMKKSGIIIPGKPKTKVVNMVASGNLGGLIDLERSAYSLGRTMYEPEQFPGLIYRVDNPKVVFLIFASGKIVCTGATKEEDVYRAVEDLHRDLEKNDLIYYG